MDMTYSSEILDAVNKTCRGVAACRAMELLHHPEPIVRDELSPLLAGPSYMALIKQRWDDAVKRSGCDPDRPHHHYFAARARILDDKITAALQQLSTQYPTTNTCSSNSSIARQSLPNGAQAPQLEQRQHQQASKATAAHQQVVCLGCGVDTRPWRLTFPADVAWYDVDQQPVIQLKHRLLTEAGAQLQQGHQQQQVPEQRQQLQQQQSQPQGAERLPELYEQQQHQQHDPAALQFQLHCSRYTMLAADVTDSSWTERLIAAGFSSSLPTVWIVEGLLYYLTAAQGHQLLQDIAAASLAGQAVVIATHIPPCNLQANQRAPTSLPLAGLFKCCVHDLVNDELPACWGPVEVSKDLFILLRAQYSAEALYPYSLEYSGGTQLDEIECVVTLWLKASAISCCS